MSKTHLYKRRVPRGGGRSIVYITARDGSRVRLSDFREQVLAAQKIMAGGLLGLNREEAEAQAAEAILELRRTKAWFSSAAAKTV